jgi:CYTH domain-containing protein
LATMLTLVLVDASDVITLISKLQLVRVKYMLEHGPLIGVNDSIGATSGFGIARVKVDPTHNSFHSPYHNY